MNPRNEMSEAFVGSDSQQASSMNGIAIAGIALKCVDLVRGVATKCYSYFSNRRACRESSFYLVAYKYYDKVCVVRRILHLVRGVREEDMSNLLDVNRRICGELQNLHMCDHISLDLSKIKDSLGSDARNDVVDLENGFVKLDALGVGDQFVYTIDSSMVRSACNAIETSWTSLLGVVSRRINKSVADIEQDLWNKHHPF